MNAPELVAALAGRWSGNYGNCRCPAHDDHNPSLTIREGDNGAPLLHCHSGCENSAIIDALRSRGLWDGKFVAGDECEPRRDERDRGHDSHKRVEAARAIWLACRPIAGTLAERYLRNRSISTSLPCTLRFHSGLKHGPTGLVFPAMVAAVTIWPSRQITGIHRTFLDHYGHKAGVADPKMSLGTLRGGAVRLRGDIDRLVLAEGIETTLSVMQSMCISAWSCLSAGGLEGVQVPATVSGVVIAGDADERGRQAANRLCERLRREGRTVSVVYPPEGKDFNDMAAA